MQLHLLALLVHAYVFLRLAPALSPHTWAQALLAGLLVASVLAIPAGLGARRARSPGGARVRAWVGLGFLGLFSSLFVLTLLRDAALLGAGVLAWVAPAALGFDAAALAALSGATGVGVPLAAVAITALGFLNARRVARVKHVDVPIAGLPDALHGFTIAQVSDVHVGPTIRRGYVEGVVRAVNRLEADLVAVTGDLVDGSVAELGPHVAPLAGLSSRHGTYFVTGNHEYYSGAHAWIHELRRMDIRVLLNEHVVLREGDATLVLAGVTDYSAHAFDASHRSDPHAAIRGAPDDAHLKVLLAHQPRSAAAAVRAGFHLQISGHTHGGQFLPWTFFVRLQQPFTAGLHRLHDLWVYVSRGTGYWGPPKRFGAPSEITRLRLVRA